MALDLGKMVGPLPLGAWVATVGGALAVGQYAKMKRKGGDDTVYDAGGIPFPTAAPLREPSFSGASVGLPSSAAPYSGPAIYSTNTEWARAAAQKLADQGTNAYLAQQTLAKYLQGLDPLTADEQGMVSTALRLTGYPPNPPTVAPPAMPPSAPPPAANRHDVLKEGEFSGVGYYNSGTVITPNGKYAYISSQKTAAAILAAGGKLYFQPTPGQFMEAPQDLDPGQHGTPLYQRIV